MRSLPGICIALVLAGCASRPAVERDPTAHLVPAPPAPATPARLGIEYLGPAPAGLRPPTRAPHGYLRANPVAVVVEGDGAATSGMPHLEVESIEPRRPEPVKRPARLRLVTADDFERDWNTAADRFMVRFLNELVGEDRRRIDRTVGPQSLGYLLYTMEHHGPNTHIDEQFREDHQYFLNRYGERLVRRPLRKALRELPIFKDVRLAVEAFKAEHVPMSGAYERARGEERSWGRLSVRMRLSRMEDPVELAWLRSGFRIASSMERIKLGYDHDLTDDLTLSLRTQTLYDQPDEFGYSVSLGYEPEESKTRFGVGAGDRVNILLAPRPYPVWRMPVEAELGVFFFVEHLF